MLKWVSMLPIEVRIWTKCNINFRLIWYGIGNRSYCSVTGSWRVLQLFQATESCGCVSFLSLQQLHWQIFSRDEPWLDFQLHNKTLTENKKSNRCCYCTIQGGSVSDIAGVVTDACVPKQLICVFPRPVEPCAWFPELESSHWQHKQDKHPAARPNSQDLKANACTWY